jgi:hypothetical protein
MPDKTMIPTAEWQQRAQNHRDRFETLTAEWREYRERKEKHPVLDFLFSYYNLKPNRLRLWSPGPEVILEGPLNNEKLFGYYTENDNSSFSLDASRYPATRLKAFQWNLELLKKTVTNTPVFNCHGLHEWCMIYQSDNIRHEQLALRADRETINDFVENTPCQCTHFDAFRFFTPEATPMIKHPLTRENQADYEQSGCLHANMDLYKWAYKIFPFIEGDLLMDCFELAIQCRLLDMKASPYDISAYNNDAIRVETPEGREEYIREQHRLKKVADPIRERLIGAYEKIVSLCQAKLDAEQV